MSFRMWYQDDSGQEHTIAFDCLLSETLEALVQTTQHPIEEGSDINDHQRPEPRTFGISAIVSNTPISDPTQNGELGESFETLELVYPQPPPPLRPNVGSVVANIQGSPGPTNVVALKFSKAPFDRIKEVTDQLEIVRKGAYLLRLETSFTSLENVELTRYTPERRVENGSSAVFNLDFKILKIISTEAVPASVVSEAIAAQKTKGSPSTNKNTEDPVAKQSLAKKLLNSDNPLSTIAGFL